MRAPRSIQEVVRSRLCTSCGACVSAGAPGVIAFGYDARIGMELLMQLEGDRRPDGLIICDDNFVEFATAGLIDAGVRPGADFDVVALANFPCPVLSPLRLTYLGFDCRALMRTCLEAIDAQKQGKPFPAMTRLSAVFERELPPEPPESPPAMEDVLAASGEPVAAGQPATGSS